MIIQEFVGKLIQLDPFYIEDEPTLENLYNHFKTIVAENERLEDIEDDRACMQQCIDELKKENKEQKELISRLQQNIEDNGNHIPHID